MKKSVSRANEGGTSCQPQGKSANTTRKTAPALPNEQTTRRFVQCCLCLRYNGNWPRNEKQRSKREPKQTSEARRMDVRRFKELCRRLDELAAILEIMECDPINADLHREASNALSQALSEIERLRSNADQHRERGSKGRLSIRRLRRVERRLYSSCRRISSRRQLRPGH